jgi:hypothetical protein
VLLSISVPEDSGLPGLPCMSPSPRQHSCLNLSVEAACTVTDGASVIAASLTERLLYARHCTDPALWEPTGFGVLLAINSRYTVSCEPEITAGQDDWTHPRDWEGIGGGCV